MEYELTVIHAPSYVHVVGTGHHTAANVRRFLVDAHRTALEQKHASLLLEANFSGPSLDLGSIFSIVTEKRAVGSEFSRIAYVDTNPEHNPDHAEFAEAAAVSLGLNVRSFQRVVEAQRWLAEADLAC